MRVISASVFGGWRIVSFVFKIKFLTLAVCTFPVLFSFLQFLRDNELVINSITSLSQCGILEAMEEAKKEITRGALIVFEGADHCGKTTQAKCLVNTLKAAGHEALFLSFPGNNSVFFER